jgi:hypothetical protein
MKYLKIIGSLAAGMALMAFATPAASATVLKSGTVTLPAGTEIKKSLATGTSVSLTTSEGGLINTCTTSEVNGKFTTAGSATETVKGTIAATGLTFSNCKNTVDVEEGGELEIHHITGTTNGTLTGKGFKVRMDTTLFGGTVTCRYSAGTSTDLGTLTGSTTGNATIDISGAVVRVQASSFLCPSTANWIATYMVTSPTNLNVEES